MFITVALTAMVLVVYWPVQHYGFVNYDDHGYVTRNALVHSGFTVNSIKRAFTDIYVGNWHPLTMLSHMLDWRIYGIRAGGHHWTNIILHILNSILLFFILQIATGALWKSAFVAALFAVHPINVESVAWISERKNVLSTFFWFASTLFYLWYARRPDWPRYLPVFIFMALGLMAKPMLVTLPFSLLLLDYWPLNRLNWRSQSHDHSAFRDAPKKTIAFVMAEKLPLFALSVAFSYATLHTQKVSNAVVKLDMLPFLPRLQNAVLSYGVYLKKLFWPFDLAVLYPFDIMMPVWQIILSASVIAAVTITAIVLRRKSPYLIVGWLWYLGTMFPVIGLVQVGKQAMADRYALIPFIGLFIVLAWGLNAGMNKLRVRAAVPVITVLSLTALATLSHQQVKCWESTFSLFSHTVQVTKNNTVAHSQMAEQLLDMNRVDDAIAHGEKALSFHPDDYSTLVRMARAYTMKKNYDRAVAVLRRAIEIQPKEIAAYGYLFNVLHFMGQAEQAKAEYAKGVKFNKDNPEIHFHFANALYLNHYYTEAIGEYAKTLQLNPRHGEATYNMGEVLEKMGKRDEAVSRYRRALAVNPLHAMAHYRLSFLLRQAGKLTEAESHRRLAVRINPAYEE